MFQYGAPRPASQGATDNLSGRVVPTGPLPVDARPGSAGVARQRTSLADEPESDDDAREDPDYPALASWEELL